MFHGGARGDEATMRAIAALEGDVAEVCGVLNATVGRLVELVADALDQDLWQGWGIHSPTHWVTWQTGLSPIRRYLSIP